MGGLTWYAGCHFTRDRDNVLLTVSKNTFAEKLLKVGEFGIPRSCGVPASPGVKLEEYRIDKPEENWPFREAVMGLVSPSNQSRLDKTNAIGPVATYCRASKLGHWKAGIGIPQRGQRYKRAW